MAAEPKFRYNDNETQDIVGDNFTQQVCPADPRYSTCFSKDGSYYIEIFGIGSDYRGGRRTVNDGIVPLPTRRGSSISEPDEVVTYSDTTNVSAQFTVPNNKYGYAWGINIGEKRTINDADSGLVGGTIYFPVLSRTAFHPSYQDDRFKTGPAPIATNGIEIVKYDSNNRPSVIAVTCFYTNVIGSTSEPERTVTIEGVESPTSVKFYAIDWSGGNGIADTDDATTIPLINPLDIDVVETYTYADTLYSLEPSKIIPDTTNNLVYLVYNGDSPGADHLASTYESSIIPRIVVVDISDISNPLEVARYDFDNIDPIRNTDYNSELSLLACCVRNNSNENFDTIKILYYDKSSRSFAVRNTYTESAERDYSSLNFGPKNNTTGHQYLYASNINSLDGNNADTNRQKVGVHILRSNDNFQTISNVKCYQLDSFWNDSADIPLSEADIGYIPQPQYAPLFAKYFGQNLLYVVYNKYINPKSAAFPERTSDTYKQAFKTRVERMNFSVLYDLASPESPIAIASHDHDNIRYRDFLGGSTTTRTSKPTESVYDIFLVTNDASNGEIELCEYRPDSLGGRDIRALMLISRLQYTDRSNIALLDNFDYSEDVPFDIDYYSSIFSETRSDNYSQMHEFMAVANGKQGAKIYYWNAPSNGFKFLQTLQPSDPEATNIEFEDIQKVLVFDGLANPRVSLVLIGNKHIFNYSYASSNNSFDLQQTISIREILGDSATDDSIFNGIRGTIAEAASANDDGYLQLFIEEHLPRQ